MLLEVAVLAILVTVLLAENALVVSLKRATDFLESKESRNSTVLSNSLYPQNLINL